MAQQIVKSLKAAKEDREDLLLIFSTFDNRLSNISDLINGDNSNSCEEEELDHFEATEKVILVDASLFDEPSRQSTSFFNPPNNLAKYFSRLTGSSTRWNSFSIAPPSSVVGRTGPIIVDRAENAIQLAILRLDDKIRHMLICNTIPLDAVSHYGSIRRVSLSFGSHDDNSGYESVLRFTTVSATLWMSV